MIVLMRCPKCGTVTRTVGYMDLDVSKMIDEYRSGMSLRGLARLHNVAYSTVRNRMLDAGVPLRNRGNDGVQRSR